MISAVPAMRVDVPQTEAAGEVPSRPKAADREADVLTLARTGDQSAFASLIRRYQNMVFSIALHTLGSRAAAEDLAQEVFFELYRSLGRIESDAHLVSWLRRVASHRCIDELRRRGHRPEVATDTLPEAASQPQVRDVFRADRLRALVAELPARARLVVVLRYQEDMEPTEIAGALRMPLNTVKSHLRRSLASLRSRLGGEGQP
jgi:RNA polymerase sigma-70 factor (ECF subfamily)